VCGVVLLAFSVFCAVQLSPRIIGDGREYLALAENLSRLQGTSFSSEQAGRWNIEDRRLLAWDGRQEVAHFWFYSALAVPFGWLARLAHLRLETAFVILNLLLLGIALVLGLRRLSYPASLFLFASPIWWWVDKVQIEVFTFSLLTYAFLLFPERPGWSMLCSGIAATQNPPVGLLIPIFAWLGRTRSGLVRVLACGAVATAIASLHPLYYLRRLSRWTPLVAPSDWRLPGIEALGAVLWDPNIGMLVQFPCALVVVFLGLSVSRLDWRQAFDRRGAMAALLAVPLFLFAFGQAVNLNHGGTPGMSRYALWLIPLIIPLLRAPALRVGRRRDLMAVVAIVSAGWSAAFFRPGLPEQYLHPRLASFLWDRYPTLHNPLPEIFAERLRHREPVNTLAATPSCSKALLLGGQWPTPCSPQAIPSACAQPGALCYANRASSGYHFVRVSRRGGVRFTWP